MSLSELSVIERVARVLAASRLSMNAEGEQASVSRQVDLDWPACRDEAVAVLKTLREPDGAMANAGDRAVWTKMIDAALTDYAAS